MVDSRVINVTLHLDEEISIEAGEDLAMALYMLLNREDIIVDVTEGYIVISRTDGLFELKYKNNRELIIEVNLSVAKGRNIRIDRELSTHEVERNIDLMKFVEEVKDNEFEFWNYNKCVRFAVKIADNILSIESFIADDVIRKGVTTKDLEEYLDSICINGQLHIKFHQYFLFETILRLIELDVDYTMEPCSNVVHGHAIEVPGINIYAQNIRICFDLATPFNVKVLNEYVDSSDIITNRGRRIRVKDIYDNKDAGKRITMFVDVEGANDAMHHLHHDEGEIGYEVGYCV